MKGNKHLNLIAQVLKSNRPRVVETKLSRAVNDAIDQIVADFAEELPKQYPNFKRGYFKDACGGER